jgi:hypothetical protein
MYIYQFAFFRQAQTEIIKAATNFKKSLGIFAYAQPLYYNHAPYLSELVFSNSPV